MSQRAQAALLLGLLVAAAGLAGCKQAHYDKDGKPITLGRYRIYTYPTGAKVWVNDTPQAQLTPTRVDPGQWAVVHLRLEQPGYAPCLVTVTRPDQGANVRCMMAPEVQP